MIIIKHFYNLFIRQNHRKTGQEDIVGYYAARISQEVFDMFDLTSELLKQIALGEDSVLELKTLEFTGNKISGPRRMKG